MVFVLSVGKISKKSVFAVNKDSSLAGDQSWAINYHDVFSMTVSKPQWFRLAYYLTVKQ